MLWFVEIFSRLFEVLTSPTYDLFLFNNRLKFDDSNNGDNSDDKEDEESEPRNTVLVRFVEKNRKNLNISSSLGPFTEFRLKRGM